MQPNLRGFYSVNGGQTIKLFAHPTWLPQAGIRWQRLGKVVD